jgi:cytochrome d ubiquinol oxidase subunit II
VAAFFQGVILGTLVQGIEVRDNQFAGSAFNCLTPFPLLCGIAVIAGYALLGATWLNMKTAGSVQDRVRQVAPILLITVLVAMAIISVWTPLSVDRIRERWFGGSNLYYLWPVPVAAAGFAFLVWRGLREDWERVPFFGTIALFLLGYAGLAISTVPYLVPPYMTFEEAAAAPSSQWFLLAGTLFLFPLVIGYTIFVYWIFRGKVTEGYH